MTAWRSSFSLCGLATAAFLIGLGLGGPVARAQSSGQPLQLLPPSATMPAAPAATDGDTSSPSTNPDSVSGSDSASAAPAPVLPTVTTPTVTTPTVTMPSITLPTVGAPASPDAPTAPSGIQVQEIGSTGSYAGTLEPADGGLGYDMWKGISAHDVETLLPRIPLPGPSPAMRVLARRLLLSNAEPPTGQADRDLLSIRAEQLARLGNLADMEAFLSVVPMGSKDPSLLAFRREVLWLKGDVDGACTQVDADLGLVPDDVDLNRQQLLCKAATGRAKEAQLGIDMLREQGQSDVWLVELVDALGGAKGAKLPADLAPSPMLYALIKTAGLAVPPEWVGTGTPALQARLAGDDTLDAATRITAAETAFAAGALPIEPLTALYGAQDVTPGQIDALLAADDKNDGPLGHAQLYGGVLRTDLPARRAQILHRALEMARRFGGYPAAAAANETSLLKLEPAPEIAWFAADAGRAFYYLGRYERAQAWLNIARNRAESDTQARDAVPTLALFAQIAGAGQKLTWAPNAVEQWRDAQAKAGDPDPALRAARLFAILAALGEPVGDQWRQMAESAQPSSGLPDTTLINRLDAASAAGRRGEVVLLSLVLMGTTGPSDAHPLVVNRVLSALDASGLQSEARAIAFETVIANGI
jgi:tetratricopeptide (TPR) repeat protein